MMDKSTSRAAGLAARAALDPEARRLASASACRHALTIIPRSAKTVAAYAAIRDEIDPRMLLDILELRGIALALPVVVAPGKPLMFRKYQTRDVLQPGPFGVPQPSASVATSEPDVLIVPMSAFDRSGRRVGYGAGFYDRSIAFLKTKRPIVTIGLAFSVQEISEVPVDMHDQFLDVIVTEKGPIFCEAPAVGAGKAG
jgi:5-formyltetrahydrofolate cyclo-ligase